MNNTLLRRLARPLFFIGVAGIIAAIVFYASGQPSTAGLWLGIGLGVLGLNALLGGDLIVGRPPRTFTARGTVVRGKVEVRAGLCDLAVGDCPNDRIAVLRYGPLGKPAFTMEDNVAAIMLKQPRPLFNVADWQTGLAGNVLWDLTARSSLGDLTLNLRDLRLETVEARTAGGHLTVVLPTRGAPQMLLTTGIGEVEVHVPPGVEAFITVSHGGLSTVQVENRRFNPRGEGYVTPGYDDANARVDVIIQARAGDVLIR